MAMSAIADISDEKTKVKNFALVGMAFGLGFIFGPVIGGILTESHIVSWFNYTTPFWFAALLSLANLLYVLFQFNETLVKKVYHPISFADGLINIKKAIDVKELRVLFVSIFLMNFGWNFFTQFSQVFLHIKFAYSPAQIGIFFAYVGIWVAISQGAIIRPVSAKYKPRRLLIISILATSIIMMLLVLPKNAAYLYLILPFLAIFYGFVQPNFSTLISNMVSDTSQGEVLGIRQSVLSLSQAMPAVIAGVSLTFSVSIPIILAGITIFLAWLVFVFLYKETTEIYEF